MVFTAIYKYRGKLFDEENFILPYDQHELLLITFYSRRDHCNAEIVVIFGSRLVECAASERSRRVYIHRGTALFIVDI